MTTADVPHSTNEEPYVVLVVVDFAADAAMVLDEAIRALSQRARGQLHLVHVITDAARNGRRGKTLDHTATRLEEVSTRLRAFIAGHSLRVLESHIGKVFVHASIGPRTQTILQVAVDVGADLIVLSGQGRPGLKTRLVRSLPQRLVEQAHCPVLVIHHKNYLGLERTQTLDPVCADCATMRHATRAETMWCEYHSRPQIRPHGYSYSEAIGLSGHDPGVGPGSG